MSADITGPYMQRAMYHYILTDRNLLNKLDGDFFVQEAARHFYPIAKAYSLKYFTPPTKEIIVEEASRTETLDDARMAQLEFLYGDNPLESVNKDYIRELIINIATWKSCVFGVESAIEFIKKNEGKVIEHPDVSKKFRERVRMLIDNPLTVNYEIEDTNGSDFWNPESHKQEKMARRSTGYPFIDTCMDGGYWDGSFTVFAGAPKVGKSQFLCNLCAQSVTHGYNSLYITLELPEPMVIGRIGANILNIPHADYAAISNTPRLAEEMKKYKMNHVEPLGELVVKSYPTSTMTAEDLEAYVLKEELARSTEDKRFKFHNIFVDYINIMRNPMNEYSENTYIKIKNIAEHLKGVGVKNNWAIITATQMSKGQYDKSDARAEDVAESSGLGATVDMLFGIIKDATCAMNNQYYIKCIYDRVAPHQEEKKLFNFDGKYLRLTEDKSAPVSCLSEQQATYRKAINGVIGQNNGKVYSGPYQGNQNQQQRQQQTPVPSNPAPVVPHISLDLTEELEDNKGVDINPRIGTPATDLIQKPSGGSTYTNKPTMPADSRDDDDIIHNCPAPPVVNTRPAPSIVTNVFLPGVARGIGSMTPKEYAEYNRRLNKH